MSDLNMDEGFNDDTEDFFNEEVGITLEKDFAGNLSSDHSQSQHEEGKEEEIEEKRTHTEPIPQEEQKVTEEKEVKAEIEEPKSIELFESDQKQEVPSIEENNSEKVLRKYTEPEIPHITQAKVEMEEPKSLTTCKEETPLIEEPKSEKGLRSEAPDQNQTPGKDTQPESTDTIQMKNPVPTDELRKEEVTVNVKPEENKPKEKQEKAKPNASYNEKISQFADQLNSIGSTYYDDARSDREDDSPKSNLSITEKVIIPQPEPKEEEKLIDEDFKASLTVSGFLSIAELDQNTMKVLSLQDRKLYIVKRFSNLENNEKRILNIILESHNSYLLSVQKDEKHNAYIMESGVGNLIDFENTLPSEKWSEVALKALFWYLCDQLTQLKALNVYHNNITPENIMITADFKIKFIDFKFAVHGTETVKGFKGPDNPYMSQKKRESIKNNTSYNPYEEDIYSIGLVILRLGLGKNISNHENLGNDLKALQKKFPTLAHEVSKALSYQKCPDRYSRYSEDLIKFLSENVPKFKERQYDKHQSLLKRVKNKEYLSATESSISREIQQLIPESPKILFYKNLLGNIALQKLKYDEAIQIFEEMLGILESKDNTLLRARCYQLMGQAYFLKGLKGNLGKALEYFKKANEIWESQHKYHESLESLNSIGEAYLGLENFEEALKIFDQVIQKDFKQTHSRIKALAYSNKGMALVRLKKCSLANDSFESAESNLRRIHPEGHPDLAALDLKRCEYYLEIDETMKALECAIKTLKYYEELYGKNNSQALAAYQVLKRISEAQIKKISN